MTTDSLIYSFCAEQRILLQQELQSEDDELLTSVAVSSERTTSTTSRGKDPADVTRSSVLHQLESSDISVGLYGRTVVQLTKVQERGSSSSLLPAHRFTTGDEVEIRSKTGTNSVSGVVCKVTEHAISVALSSSQVGTNNGHGTKTYGGDQSKKRGGKPDEDETDEDSPLGAPPLSLIPKSSLEVHKKLMQALDELEKHGVNHPIAGKVIHALFDAGLASQTSTTRPFEGRDDSTLDPTQQEAIEFCLEGRPLALIHGPPGTGKTTTVAELVQRAVQQYQYRVLVTAPSNVAVDNILARLVKKSGGKDGKARKQKRLSVVRLGHPARLQEEILPFSLEALVQGAEGTEIVADVRRELESFLRLASNPRTSYPNRLMARREIKSLRREIRTREERVVKELMQNADVVLATCVGAANRKLLADATFDLVIIDEAAQALEAACWIPILRGAKVVLAGDHCQLPPTVKCNNSEVQTGLGRTMFERVMDLYHDDPSRVSRMLQVQYRMHENIAEWASHALYHGKLTTHSTAQGRTLSTLEGVHRGDGDDDDDIATTSLLLIDTAGSAMYELTNTAGSRYNPGEAELVEQHVRKLLRLGVDQSQIAIITPYNGQVELLRSTLLPNFPRLEVRTVDGFQGGEREAVVLSLVRSSDERGGGIGFLRDDRRLNVAVTRAKRHCCIICDSETVSQSPFVKNLLDWVEEHGSQKLALELMCDEVEITGDLEVARIELEKAITSKPPKRAEPAIPRRNDSGTETMKALEAILDKVKSFVVGGKPGDEMSLSLELSKADRKAVHELAETLGVGHQSEGIEGVDRRIRILIPAKDESEVNLSGQDCDTVKSQPEASILEEVDLHDTTSEVGADVVRDINSRTASLMIQMIDFDSDEDGNDAMVEIEASTDQAMSIQRQATDGDNATQLLKSLAKEREARSAHSKKKITAPTNEKTNSKTKKNKGQRLGGTVVKPPKNDDNMDHLDDLAFLDAQISQVQNSHGRTIVGTGSTYRSIVNGVLLSKPAQPVAKKDSRISAALQSKLNEAQAKRKTKPKKK